MATVPTPFVWTTATRPSSADLQGGVQAPLEFLLRGAQVAQVTQATAQNLTTATWTDVTMNAEVVDLDGQHSTTTNTPRVNIGNTLGWYLVSGVVAFASSAAGNYRRARLALNGAAIDGSFASLAVGGGGSPTAVTPTMLVQSTLASDYVTLQGWHDAGVTLATAVGGEARSSLTVYFVRAL